ncbi:hypothetical protein DFH09DRAFT_1313929 [Mycena vulgaris]|nr:hypothetical protein DFH09DRAFT_1313929 [Mycena vulgaris]
MLNTRTPECTPFWINTCEPTRSSTPTPSPTASQIPINALNGPPTNQPIPTQLHILTQDVLLHKIHPGFSPLSRRLPSAALAAPPAVTSPDAPGCPVQFTLTGLGAISTHTNTKLFPSDGSYTHLSVIGIVASALVEVPVAPGCEGTFYRCS